MSADLPSELVPTARHAASTAPTDHRVIAEELALTTRRGPVFGPVSFVAEANRLTLVTGPSGTGRSALLLAITGRMTKITGRLQVAGIDGIARHRALRAATAVARIGDLVDLEPQLTISESITERTLLDAVNPTVGHARFHELGDLLGLELSTDVLVDDLTAPQRTILSVLLAAIRPSRLIVLDDLDRSASGPEQIMIIDSLIHLCTQGHTVVATTIDPDPAATDTAVVRLAPTPTLD